MKYHIRLEYGHWVMEGGERPMWASAKHSTMHGAVQAWAWKMTSLVEKYKGAWVYSPLKYSDVEALVREAGGIPNEQPAGAWGICGPEIELPRRWPSHNRFQSQDHTGHLGTNQAAVDWAMVHNRRDR